MRKFLTIGILVLAVAACEETFDTPPTSLLVVDVKYSSGSTSDVPLISLYGLGNDSVLISAEETSQFYFPLSTAESSSFVILFDSIYDTLTVVHQNIINYESIESGFFYEYKINAINHTLNRIESVVVLDSAVTQIWNENITLYINDLPSDNVTE